MDPHLWPASPEASQPDLSMIELKRPRLTSKYTHLHFVGGGRCAVAFGALFVEFRHFLRIALTALQQHRTLGGDMGLPSQGTDILWPSRIRKNIFNLFECLACRFREHEEDVDEHGGAEDTENDICPPLDAHKRWGNEVAEGKVEGPVCGRGECNCFPTDAQRIELWRIDPTDWAPRGSVRSDEKVRARDDRF